MAQYMATRCLSRIAWLALIFLSQNDTQLVSNLKMGEMNSVFIEFMSGLLIHPEKMGVPRKLNLSNKGHVFTFDPFDPICVLLFKCSRFFPL